MIKQKTVGNLTLKLGRNGELHKEAADLIRAGLKAQGTPIPDSVVLKIGPESGWPDCDYVVTAEWSE